MGRLVTGKTFALTSSRSDRKRKRQVQGKGKCRCVKFEEALPVQEVYRADPEERTSHKHVLLGWAVLDCGEARSLARAELCRQRWLRLARNVVAEQEMIARLRLVGEKHQFRGIGEQVITLLIKLQVLEALRGQGASRTQDHRCLHAQSVGILVIAGWQLAREEPSQK